MEQREQKPNLFGLCRVVTEEDEVKLARAMPWRQNVCIYTNVSSHMTVKPRDGEGAEETSPAKRRSACLEENS